MTQDAVDAAHQLLHKLLAKTTKDFETGVDEVGKGCLFGPVFAGAVILGSKEGEVLIDLGLRDSKKLSKKKRAELVPFIKKNCMGWGLGQSSAKEIDALGIRQATEKAMIRALEKLPIKPNLLLVDGVLPLRSWSAPQKTLKRGEDKSAAIAAASVLAKEARDSLITKLSLIYPEYGLEKHFGYGTLIHRKALVKFGASPQHRISFLSKIIV